MQVKLTFPHCVFEMGENGNVAGGSGRCRLNLSGTRNATKSSLSASQCTQCVLV